MNNRDLYIAAYDVGSARRLRAVLKLVKGHATGGQKSAYECFLTTGERRHLLERLREVIEPAEDRVLLIRARSSLTCPHAWNCRSAAGSAVFLLWVTMTTLYLDRKGLELKLDGAALALYEEGAGCGPCRLRCWTAW